MENMKIYEAVRAVPDNATREIQAGRLKGKTDINPMWRIKKLTEQFGPCGIGWKYEITREWMENGANGEIAAFVDINLYYKWEGEWSAPIPGTGGSAFVASERNGLYTSDECFKMALTDAISVACKALGFAGDVYWEKDSSKYDRPPETPPVPNCSCCKKAIAVRKNKGKLYTPQEIAGIATKTYGAPLCWDCMSDIKTAAAEAEAASVPQAAPEGETT